jgi:hypothetical protein
MPGRWRLLIFRRSIPTGNPYQEQIVLPKSAREYTFRGILFSYPVTGGVFREIFFEVFDTQGRSYTSLNFGNPAMELGAKGTLFSSPGVDTTPAAAGDTSSFRGFIPINEKFQGQAVLFVNIRGALATPNPAFIDLLLLGRILAKGAPPQ